MSGWHKARRLVAGQWWVGDGTGTSAEGGHHSWLVLAALAVTVAALGVADYATGPLLSLAVFYLVPTAIGTVVAGRRVGFALALEGATASTVASLLSKSHQDVVFVLNGVLLSLILAVIVVLIGAVRETAMSASVAARQRKEFLAYAAHQLRTPLAGIRASTDALLVGGATSHQEPLLVNLSREADRAGRLLSSLLQMARVDQGDVGVPQMLDLVDLCQSELDRYRPRGPRDTAVATKLIMRGSRPPSVLASGEAIKNALGNLLDNARRHARGQIIVEVVATPAEVKIAVIDDGAGLPDGMRERVFERFVSLDGEGGSGLGLPIARGLIEAQGGRLTYEDGHFVIRLPTRKPPPSPPPPPA